ncbi:hypothetical protein GQ457_17G006350 [Hibiscus cannabinus]
MYSKTKNLQVKKRPKLLKFEKPQSPITNRQQPDTAINISPPSVPATARVQRVTQKKEAASFLSSYRHESQVEEEAHEKAEEEAPKDETEIQVGGAISLVSQWGVVRDHFGAFLFSYSKSIGTTTVLQAELWGILEGLRIARDRGCVRIQVQSDSAAAINLLSPPYMLSSFSLVRSIAIFCVGVCDIVFSTIPREANMVADFMSKLDSSSSIAIYDSVSPTSGLRDLLYCDSFGPPYVRISHL